MERTRTSGGPADPGPARVIGPYRLIEKIGQGGMGDVWLAEQQEPIRRRVALKLIKAGLDSGQILARFETERQALALMDHPAIARIFDAGETEDGLPYFVMEHVAGIPITEYCDRHRLSTRARLELFRVVCDGVQHAHRKAIIHRDLKPSNILVKERDGTPEPKIIDFGVAKATAKALTERTLCTELGMLIGTPEYMSPEQADLTPEDVDTRTDVYSLGAVLYELLVGVLPFDPRELRKAGFDEIRRRIREVDPPRPSTRLDRSETSAEQARNRGTDPPALVRQLRGDLDWITMKALEKSRSRRYGSPSDLAADVERYLGHQPVVARPPSARYRAGKFVRRHRLGVGVSTALAALVLAFSVATVVQSRRIARERDRADRVSEFLAGIFTASDPYRARGETLTARELLDAGVRKIDADLRGDPALQATLLQILARVHHNLGLYERAESLIGRAVELRLRTSGSEHPDTLRALRLKGAVLEKRGRYSEAEAVLEPALETSRRRLGEDHECSLDLKTTLASVALAAGRYQEAADRFRGVYEGRLRALGPDHVETLTALSDLASLTYSQGHYEEAERLSADCLPRLRRVAGAEDPQTLSTILTRGLTLIALGRSNEGLPLLREALPVSVRVNGPENMTTLEFRKAVVYALALAGRYAEAEPACRETLAAQQKSLGENHPATIPTLIYLARSLVPLGRLDESERLYRKALDVLARNPDIQDPYDAHCWVGFGLIEARRGRFARSLAWLRKAVERSPDLRETLGSEPELAPFAADPEFRKLVAPAG